MLIGSIWLLCMIPLIHMQVIPTSYATSIPSVSVNGSQEGGGCSSFSSFRRGELCSDPASSVLFDNVIPRINNSTTWARELLVLPSENDLDPVSLTFVFRTLQTESSIEIVMLNCSSQDIGADYILVKDHTGALLKNISIADALSCNHLIRICTIIYFPTSSNTIIMTFIRSKVSSIILYLGEITFNHSLSNDCEITPITTATSLTTSTIVSALTSSIKKEASTVWQQEITSTSPQHASASQSITLIIVIAVVLSFIFVSIIILAIVIFLIFRKNTKKKHLSEHYILNDGIPQHHSSEVTAENTQSRGDICGTNENPVDSFSIDIYATVDEKKNKIPEVVDNRDISGKDEVKEENKYTDTSEMYAVVNKKEKKKNIEEDKDAMEMYAVVDKKKRRSKVNVDADISQMYAVVDKTKKENKVKDDGEVSQMYAVVNKTKEEREFDDDAEMSQMYAVVDITKKKQNLVM